jgi:hypothetical protein
LDFDIFSPPTSSHQHRRPNHGVEAGDVFADELNGRPTPFEVLDVGAVADRGDVVEQRVEPDVDHVAVIPRNLDAPVEARPRDGEVVEALLHERDDLVAHALGLDEVGLGLVQVEQFLLEIAHPKEVVLLLEDLHRAAVDLAHQLAGKVAIHRFHEVIELLVLLTTHAVVALVFARIDEAVVVELLQEDRDGLLVALIGGADEIIVGDVDRLQQRQPGIGDELVGPLPRSGVVRHSCSQDLLPVLVGAGEQPGVVTGLAVPPGKNVGGNLRRLG